MMTTTGLFNFSAPEMLTGGQIYSEKVDLWSFGCCLYLMVTGFPPFSNEK